MIDLVTFFTSVSLIFILFIENFLDENFQVFSGLLGFQFKLSDHLISKQGDCVGPKTTKREDLFFWLPISHVSILVLCGTITVTKLNCLLFVQCKSVACICDQPPHP